MLKGIELCLCNYVYLLEEIDIVVDVGECCGEVMIFKVFFGVMYCDGFYFYQLVNGVWLIDYVFNKYFDMLQVFFK